MYWGAKSNELLRFHRAVYSSPTPSYWSQYKRGACFKQVYVPLILVFTFPKELLLLKLSVRTEFHNAMPRIFVYQQFITAMSSWISLAMQSMLFNGLLPLDGQGSLKQITSDIIWRLAQKTLTGKTCSPTSYSDRDGWYVFIDLDT